MSRDKIISAVLFCCIALGAWAQKPMPELKRTAEHYRSLTAFSIKVNVDFYTEEGSAKPGKTMQGSAQIMGQLSYSVFDGRESIMGKDFILVADHGNRSIYYSPREKNAKSSISGGAEMLDSAFLSKYNISEKQLDDATLEYRLVPKKAGGEFKSVSIKLNRTQHILKEIVYLYNGDVKYKKVVVKYTDFKPSVDSSKNLFSESKFITGHQKKAALQPAYSSYQLINSFNYDPKKNLIER